MIKEIIEREGGPAAFSRETGIPLRTVESWNQTAKSKRCPPEWLVPILNDWLKMPRLYMGHAKALKFSDDELTAILTYRQAMRQNAKITSGESRKGA